MASRRPLIVITGPTASGKSGLALELAERYGGEIICADSRTIYEGMDIGTAKPTHSDRERVPHHLLDVVKPGENFSAADFQDYAKKAIKDIRARNRVPFLVGGTGLYINSVVLDYTFDSEYSGKELKKMKNELELKNIEELHAMIEKQHIKMPHNLKNKRHLIGALLHGNRQPSARTEPVNDTYVVSITTDKSILRQRICDRADEIFSSDVVGEAVMLAEKYGWDNEAMSGNIYPILREVIEGAVTIDQAKEKFIRSDTRLVKKQNTWLKKWNFIHPFTLDEARYKIEQILASRH